MCVGVELTGSAIVERDKAAMDVHVVARVVRLVDRDHIARVSVEHRYGPITGRLLRVGAVECERGHGYSQCGDSGQHQCKTKMPQAHRLLLGFGVSPCTPRSPPCESGAAYPVCASPSNPRSSYDCTTDSACCSLVIGSAWRWTSFQMPSSGRKMQVPLMSTGVISSLPPTFASNRSSSTV